MNYKQRIVLLSTAALFVMVSSNVSAQTNNDITNEHRLTLVVTKPVSDKVVVFGYLGVVKSPDKNVGTLYYAPPGVVYRPKPWMEVWGGLFGIYNNNKSANNSWELRPLTGLKFYVPNNKKINLYNFTRFEYRFINQNHNTQSIPRLRNRVGIEVPLSKEKAWNPKTFYTLGDVEPVWRLDDKFLQFVRVRTGLGYVINPSWRVEFIYHAEFSGAKGEPTNYTGNIWRINFKLNLPRKGKRPVRPVEIDE